MNDSAYYLAVVLERLVRDVLDMQKELTRDIVFIFLKMEKAGYDFSFDKSILTGRYIVIEKLLRAVASLGIFDALPKELQGHITPRTLTEDLKKGNVKRILLFEKAFTRIAENVKCGDINLKLLFAELIREAQALKSDRNNPHNEGKRTGYYFCVLTLYNQAQVLVPELFETLPQELRDFNPDSLILNLS